MEKNILWQPWTGPGLEHLHLAAGSKGISADSLIIGIRDGIPFRVRYKIRCDSGWRVQHLEVDLLDDSGEDIRMHADGRGNWIDDAGDPLPFLDGCLDVDISATPFTNTLPIRRLGMKSGDTAQFSVVYMAVPEMEIKVDRQRYTCLELNDQGGTYQFESHALFPGFTAELQVDSNCLVSEYPELFRRVLAGDR